MFFGSRGGWGSVVGGGWWVDGGGWWVVGGRLLPAYLLGVDGGGDVRGAFVELREDGVVDVVVDEEYARLGALDEVGDEGVGIVYLSVEEDALCRGCGHADVEVELLLLAGLGVLYLLHLVMLHEEFCINVLLHLKHLLVYGISAEQIFLQHFIGPLAEANTLLSIDSETNGYYHVEIIIVKVAGNHTIAFLSNCSEIPNSCLAGQFFLLEYVSDVLTDVCFA